MVCSGYARTHIDNDNVETMMLGYSPYEFVDGTNKSPQDWDRPAACQRSSYLNVYFGEAYIPSQNIQVRIACFRYRCSFCCLGNCIATDSKCWGKAIKDVGVLLTIVKRKELLVIFQAQRETSQVTLWIGIYNQNFFA